MSQHRRSQRLALAAAIFMPMAATIPAFAADTVVSSHEQAQQLRSGERHQVYAYEKQTFICGETTDKEGKRRSLVGEPYEPRLPMWEPKKDDPIWTTWDITFKIICKNFDQQPNIDTASGDQRSVR
ncbi:MAG TPA: hypothetical protein VNR65_05630 [Geobacterales bacterium]|nr:hypothetical protein [Geobacterales bacterium]